MTDQEALNDVEEEVVAEPTADDVLAAALMDRFDLVLDPSAKWDLCLIAQATQNLEVLSYLKDEQQFTVLLDITAVDYLSFPGHRGERFAVVYLLKNIDTCQRVSIKVMLEEDDLSIRSACSLFKIADWAERETYDQYGIDFRGHKNLKRILNHHEFIGHPLRKDYPVQKRQKLNVNDSMIDELHAELERNGYKIIEAATEEEATDIAAAGEES